MAAGARKLDRLGNRLEECTRRYARCTREREAKAHRWAIMAGKTRGRTSPTPEDDDLSLRTRFTLLAELSRELTSSLETNEVLRRLVEGAAQLTKASYGALGVFDTNGSILQFITHGLSEAERRRIGDLPQGHGLLGLLQERAAPLRVEEIADHPRSVGFPAGHPPMHSFLGVPVRAGGESFGNLYLTEKGGGEPFTDDDEHIISLLASHAALAIRNAREYERAQQAATDREAERQRLAVLVDTSPVGVFVVEPDGTVSYANVEAQRISGATIQEGVHLSTYRDQTSIRRPDGSEADRSELPLERALHNGERVMAEELRFEFSDGHGVPVLVNAAPVRSAGGVITGAIAVVQDLTPIEELERLRNEFLAMVSHELKTPLTAIKGSAAIALGGRMQPTREETVQLFEIIDEQSDRLRDLVDNLLDVTRIEAGRLTVEVEPTELAPLVAAAVQAINRHPGAHTITVEGDGDLPFVSADSRRVEQVLVNLLTNAAKFSPDETPISINVTPDPDQARITVRVTDQGRGLSREEMPRLFTKFARLDPDAHGADGHGLGLAVCKGIVEAHGGRIWAESPGLGGGSSFCFTLPISSEQPAEPTVNVALRAEHMGRIGRRGERTRVLVIDDEPQILRYVQRALDHAGFRALVTTNPAEGLQMAELEEPDLILLDMNLPGIDGFEMLKRLREFSGVPVVFLTAQRDSELAAKALRAGADDYVTKPFAPSELLARIEVSLRRRVAPDQTEVRKPYEYDGLRVDFADRRVYVGGSGVELSATEYKVLFELASNPGRVLTHDQLLRNVWGPEYQGESGLVRSFIRNLRAKLGDDARNPRFIRTETGVGYRMPRPGE